MKRNKLQEWADADALERERFARELQKAKQELRLAEWRFNNATGEVYVDYAIYCLDAAEKKLDMLLRQAKWYWDHAAPIVEEGGAE
ncbi:MAG: DUF2508 family protein [Candidatus Cohnella colombiensis]|uniref:DUF2508 family protein n=1 Tax=Candidatus Cohnella colombiensis TaxID=3121368 RepID=A0AA95EW47_9BACL|nr:MAG: DUF2508 family protein [Cohnella sp.]